MCVRFSSNLRREDNFEELIKTSKHSKVTRRFRQSQIINNVFETRPYTQEKKNGVMVSYPKHSLTWRVGELSIST